MLALSILAAGGRRPCPSLRLPVEDLCASLSFAPEFALARHGPLALQCMLRFELDGKRYIATVTSRHTPAILVG